MKVLRGFVLLLAVLALAATLISFIPSDFWLIRTFDMVRELLVFVCIALLVASIFLLKRMRWAAVAIFALVIVMNVWRVWPYWNIAGTELALADDAGEDARCFTSMAVNVKVKNTDYDRVAKQIRQYDPDALFLMETDEAWMSALAPVLSDYPDVTRHAQPKAFGLAFATRLPTSKVNVVENTHRDTPTLYATLQPEGFPPVEFIGLHPKPPLPGWNTQMRDENIVNAGVQTPERLPDAIVMGDFNDVPWSRTTTRFREEGDWRDPRIGRGSYPTFPASYLPLGWPLDQLMIKGDIEVASFEVLPSNGSDHRAIFTRICAP